MTPTRPGRTSPRAALWPALRAMLVPVGSCVAALALLVGWTQAGGADSPARLSVGQARVLVPVLPDGDATSAYFTVRNTGGSDDILTSISSTLPGEVMLSRQVVTDSGAHTMGMAGGFRIGAGKTLRMSPSTVNVMIEPAPELSPGQRIRFTLEFRDSDPITVTALAARPGTF